MTSKPHSTEPKSRPVTRTLRVRLYPGNAANGLYLEQLAGACRFAWNRVLAEHQTAYRMWRSFGKLGLGPGSPTFFTLGKRFTKLRNAPGNEWLHDYSHAIVKYACKYMADAYAAFFDPDRPDHGCPQFKAKYYTEPGFTIPSNVRIGDGSLYIPKRGWMRLGPLRRYADCKPLTVRCKQESERRQPTWYAYITFEVPVGHPDVCPPAGHGAVGVDRNVGQATDSTGAVHSMLETTVEDAKIKRYQRRMARQQKGSKRRRGTGGKLRKLNRKQARRRDTTTHQISRKIADTAHTVVLEDLDTKSMTKSAKGTVENPGRNVKAKSGLNRAILASGWGQLEQKLTYKAGQVVKVDPAYTSQACSRCGHTAKSNRPSQAVFACGACGFQANADHNAAVNILARAGLPHGPVQAHVPGASARGGAIPPWPAARSAKGTPMSREPELGRESP
ncbi:MAG: transposase [Caldilineaceae bacterium]|nr:transposase [Caldilineaceae bacterium]